MFNVEKLIASVEKRPCIWNIRHSCYADKQLKMKSWQKVCEELYPEWKEFSSEEMNGQIIYLQRKWKSIRDYYAKQKRELSAKVHTPTGYKKRKCGYFDMLHFLDKVSSERVNRYLSSSPGTKFEEWPRCHEEILLSEESQEKSPTIKFEEEVPSDPLVKTGEEIEDAPHSHPIKSEVVIEEEEEEIREEWRGLDEDKMFLMSLLPSIKEMSPLEKINFKLEVMASLKKHLFPQN